MQKASNILLYAKSTSVVIGGDTGGRIKATVEQIVVLSETKKRTSLSGKKKKKNKTQTPKNSTFKHFTGLLVKLFKLMPLEYMIQLHF